MMRSGISLEARASPFGDPCKEASVWWDVGCGIWGIGDWDWVNGERETVHATRYPEWVPSLERVNAHSSPGFNSAV